MQAPATLRVVLTNAIFVALLAIGACTAPPRTEPDPPLREFRGVFVTTAYNLDWPSRPGLHRKVQIDEIRAVVNRVKELNCNVIILQVRAFGDRIHRHTKIQPPERWAVVLNHGNDPDPRPNRPPALKYDPLHEWIVECHNAGIELHAWVNPFRVDSLVTVEGRKPTTLPAHATEDGYHMYLDATHRDVQEYAIKVIAELLDYRVDNPGALHGLDGLLFDHNWGYAPKGNPAPPGMGGAAADSDREGVDREAARKPPVVNPKKARIKWLLKKANEQPQPASPPGGVDEFIKKVFAETSRRRVKFGFSPAAIDDQANRWLNQQVKRWMREHLVNYVAPELYFRDDLRHPFKQTLEDWLAEVPAPAREPGFTPIVVAGLFTTRVQSPEPDSDDPWPAEEITQQIETARSAQDGESQPGAQAHYAWSALRSPGQGGPGSSNNIGERLKKGLYAQPALVPVCTEPPPGTSAPPPPRVDLRPHGKAKTATWKHTPPDPEIFCWAVWLHQKNQWGPMQIFGGSTGRLEVPATVDRVAVKAIDRYNRESDFGMSP